MNRNFNIINNPCLQAFRARFQDKRFMNRRYSGVCPGCISDTDERQFMKFEVWHKRGERARNKYGLGINVYELYWSTRNITKGKRCTQ